MLRAASAPRVLSVAQLAALIKEKVEGALGVVWVAGELSNLRRQPTGHVYFTLKDDTSQLAAVMFRSVAQTVVFRLDDGMQVVVRARVTVWPPRGALQLTVDAIEPRGVGALQLAFEQLKAKLQAEGLFAATRKRPLPRVPRAIGIVTALGGAAIHDMLTVLRRRWPAARVVMRAVRVQGPGAAREVAAGIADLNAAGNVDVLIVGRGGGSLEDLWAFNEEIVARAIVASAVPVVSAVGHEVDFTIADFVADVRAPTPTAAGALVVPDRAELAAAVTRTDRALRAALTRRVTTARERLDRLERGLGDPRRRLVDVARRLGDLGHRVGRGLVRRLAWDRRELETLARRLRERGPGAAVARAEGRLEAVARRLPFVLDVRVQGARGAVAQAAARLEALSPLACLGRGYAIARRSETGAIVTDATTLAPGDLLRVRFARGQARARVDGVEPGEA